MTTHTKFETTATNSLTGGLWIITKGTQVEIVGKNSKNRTRVKLTDGRSQAEFSVPDHIL